MATIFLVDDDFDFLYQSKIWFSQANYKVITCQSSIEAAEQIKNIKPDIALIDLMMETNDSGFILARKIKQQYPDIPVIMLTAVSSELGISFDANEKESKSWLFVDAIIDKGKDFKYIQKIIEQYIS
ncbi:MAG TPA: response regulator [Bacteroidales bacterium]|jgi:CheY-like chemotaxis protein|nr:response regulator [Bacteroidales bacterium]HNV96403.1 response regulator [Bacteroidales bacterium]HOU97447.1 response regulator [Bacteroidales bacterium]